MIDDSLIEESPETPISGGTDTVLESPGNTHQISIYSLLVEWAALQPEVCRVSWGAKLEELQSNEPAPHAAYFLLGLCWAVNIRHAQDNCFTPAELAGIREVVEQQAVEHGCRLATTVAPKPMPSSAMLISSADGCLGVKFQGSPQFAALDVWIDYLRNHQQAQEAQEG